MKSKDPKQKVIIHMLWLNFSKYTFQILAAGNESYNKLLKKSVFSIRPITAQEKKSIKENVIRIVTAKEGETLESLSQRTNNVLGLEYLCLINDVQANTKLKKGQLIKIAKAEAYKSKN